MLRDIINLVKWYREIPRSAQEAADILDSYIKKTNPNLLDECNRFFSESKNINVTVLAQTIGEAVCNLENEPFDENKRQISIFAGATARVSDNLLDNRVLSPEKVFLLNLRSRENTKDSIPNQKLFYALDDRLTELLPSNFILDFRQVIELYNQAQADSVKLFEQIDREDIISIKDRAGGYSALLSYSFLFPKFGDPTLNLIGCYEPHNRVFPKTKAEALYNFGAWLSRIDDLCDEPYDKKICMKQLATEGCVTWDSLRQETDYTFGGLKYFYLKEKVERFREVFKPFDSRILTSLLRYLFR